MPEIIPRLLGVAAIELPRYHAVHVEDGDLSQVAPVELRADLVITLRDARGGVVAGIVFESQTRIDPIKLFTWPLYAMIERAQIRCPVYLVVFTRSHAVARWAAAPISIGPDGACFRCIVIGPQSIPRIRRRAEARAQPELAVLSAVSHGNERGGLEIVRAALKAAFRLDDERRTYYYRVIWHALGKMARRQLLEESMLSKKRRYENPIEDFFQEAKATGGGGGDDDRGAGGGSEREGGGQSGGKGGGAADGACGARYPRRQGGARAHPRLP